MLQTLCLLFLTAVLPEWAQAVASFVSPHSSSVNNNSQIMISQTAMRVEAHDRGLSIAVPANLPLSYYPIMDGYTLTSSNHIDTIALLPSLYTIQLDFWLSAVGSSYESIITVGAPNGQRLWLPALFLKVGGSMGWWPSYDPLVETMATTACNTALSAGQWYAVTLKIDTTALLFSFAVAASGTYAACAPAAAALSQTAGQTYTNMPVWATMAAGAGISGKIRNFVISEPKPTAAPTTTPTPRPTPQPSAPSPAPSPSPSARPSQMAPAAGPYYFHTFHAGSECSSTPSRYSVESYQVGSLALFTVLF